MAKSNSGDQNTTSKTFNSSNSFVERITSTVSGLFPTWRSSSEDLTNDISDSATRQNHRSRPVIPNDYTSLPETSDNCFPAAKRRKVNSLLEDSYFQHDIDDNETFHLATDEHSSQLRTNNNAGPTETRTENKQILSSTPSQSEFRRCNFPSTSTAVTTDMPNEHPNKNDLMGSHSSIASQLSNSSSVEAPGHFRAPALYPRGGTPGSLRDRLLRTDSRRSSLSNRNPTFKSLVYSPKHRNAEGNGNISPFYAGRSSALLETVFDAGRASKRSPYSTSECSRSGNTSPALSVSSSSFVIPASPSSRKSECNVSMSSAARKILDTLERYSSPIVDAKRIPINERKVAGTNGTPMANRGVKRRMISDEPDAHSSSISDIIQQRRKELFDSSMVNAKRLSAAGAVVPTANIGSISQRLATPLKDTKPVQPESDSESSDDLNEDQIYMSWICDKKREKETEKDTAKAPRSPKMPAVSEPQPLIAKLPISDDVVIEEIPTSFTFSKPLVVTTELENQTKILRKKSQKSVTFKDIISESSETVTSSTVTVSSSDRNAIITRSPNTVVSPSVAGTKCNETTSAASATSSGWGDMFKLSSDTWACKICFVRNKTTEDRCVACQTPKVSTLPTTTKPLSITFLKPDDTWACDNCWVRNKKTDEQCKACGVAQTKVDSTPKTTLVAATVSTSVAPVIKISKPEGTWVCPSCWVTNDETDSTCKACSTPKVSTSATTKTSAAEMKPISFGTSSSIGIKFGISQPSQPPLAESGGFKFGTSSAEKPLGFTFGYSNRPSSSADKGIGNDVKPKEELKLPAILDNDNASMKRSSQEMLDGKPLQDSEEKSKTTEKDDSQQSKTENKEKPVSVLNSPFAKEELVKTASNVLVAATNSLPSAVTENRPPFTFGGFNASQGTTSSEKLFTFGRAVAAEQKPSTSAFPAISESSTQGKSAFSFLKKDAAQLNDSSVPKMSSGPTEGSQSPFGSIFGNGPSGTSSNPPTFGSFGPSTSEMTKTTQTLSPFSSAKPAEKPAFSFGGPQTTTASAPKLFGSSQFSFGTGFGPATSSASEVVSFGITSPQFGAVPATTTVSAPTFSNVFAPPIQSQPQQQLSIFGGSTADRNGPVGVFGALQQPQQQLSNASIGGIFGTSQQQLSNASTGGFHFGDQMANHNPPSVFGSNAGYCFAPAATQQTPPTFSTTTIPPVFNFTGGQTPTSFTAQPSGNTNQTRRIKKAVRRTALK